MLLEKTVRYIRGKNDHQCTSMKLIIFLVNFYAGEGDTGDVWEIVCDGTAWERDDAIRFRHVDTDAYLAASGNTYGRPIHGQMEIVGVAHSDSASYWKAMEGVFVHPTEASGSSNTHDEL